jgi:hypothetical protein
MVSDKIGLKLHDLATTGHPLTLEEQDQLQAWYADKDQAEAVIFGPSNQPLPDVAVLQNQIDQALVQLASDIQQIQSITQENNVLRQENADLKQQINTRRSA